MSRKAKPLKVVVENPPSEEHIDELIKKINEAFKNLYPTTKIRNEKKTTK